MLSTAGAEHIITMDLHASQIQVLPINSLILCSQLVMCLASVHVCEL